MANALEEFERWSAEHKAELEAALTKQGCIFDPQLGIFTELDENKQAYFESCYRRFQVSMQEAARVRTESFQASTE
jgi:hypothetical protein